MEELRIIRRGLVYRFGLDQEIPVHATFSKNRTGGIPASGSRKRLTMFRVTPSATPEHNLGWLDSSSMPHVLRRFLRPSLT